MDLVRSADAPTQRGFLGGHPALSAAALATSLTADSAAEQAALGLAGLDDAAGRFAALSAAYEARHGFAFIICARRHTPSSVLAQLERRLDQNEAAERAAALGEVFFISRLRLVARVSGPGVPNTTGSLAVTVEQAGAPAAHIRVELWRDGAKMCEATTGADGAVVLLQGEPLRIEPHELRVHVGTVIPVRWRVTEPEANVQVALAVGPEGVRVSM